MSFDVFIGICILLVWASLPLTVILASRDFNDEVSDDSEHH